MARWIAVLGALVLVACGNRSPTAEALSFSSRDTRLTIEIDTDELVHFEFSQDRSSAGSIATTPMVARTHYPGATHFENDGRGTVTTAKLRISVDRATLCIRFDRAGEMHAGTSRCSARPGSRPTRRHFS